MMKKHHAPELPPVEALRLEDLAGVESLELRGRLLAEGFLAGIHRSGRSGSCPEFREFRAYVPGDEPRRIDWRASARSDSVLLRLREEESNLRAKIILDSSRSMAFRGEKALFSKWDYARTLAAALAWILHRQQDLCGLDVVGAELEASFPYSSRRSALTRMIASLERAASGKESAVGAHLLNFAAKQELSHGILIVLSDFYMKTRELEEALLCFRGTGNQVLLFQILDPGELALEYTRSTQLLELEGEENRFTVHPDLDAEAYEARMEKHLQSLADAASGSGTDWSLCRTDMLPMQALEKILSASKRRR